MIQDIKIDPTQRTPEQVFQQLRTLIVTMELRPGERVSEQAIARSFGVSRTPVREAVFQLANMGLVKVLPQRGTFIAKLQRSSLLETVFIRQALEEAVISATVGNLDKKTIDAAQDLINQQKKAAKSNNAFKFKLLDDQFHMNFSKATGYERIGTLIEIEKTHMDRLRYLGLTEIQGEYTEVVKQHQTILDAVADGDRNAAIRGIQNHIQRITKIVDLAYEAHPDYFDDNNA